MTRATVALCTYNGARFLRQQLQSIAAQTKKPDSVVISDDASSDDTVTIAREFARSSPFPVDIHIHPARLGVSGNFDRAISLVNGDVIFLADQDDVWHPEKMERLLAVFDDARVTCVFTDARLVDENGTSMDHTLWQQIRYRPSPRLFDTLADRNVATGATMAFRAELRRLILPIPRDQPHDWWIALLAAATDGLHPMAAALIDYRVHRQQQAGAGPQVGSLRTWIEASMQTGPRAFRDRADRLALVRDRLASRGVAIDVDERIAHLLARASMRGVRRPLLVARELLTGRYFRYSRHLVSAAKDLFGIASLR